MVQEVFEIINSLNNKIIEATKAKNQAENKLNIINKELAKHTGRNGAVMMEKISRLVEINEVAEVKAWAKDQAIAKLHRKIDEAVKLMDQCSDKKTAGFVRSLLKE